MKKLNVNIITTYLFDVIFIFSAQETKEYFFSNYFYFCVHICMHNIQA